MRLFQIKLDKIKLKQLIEGGTDAKVNWIRQNWAKLMTQRGQPTQWKQEKMFRTITKSLSLAC